MMIMMTVMMTMVLAVKSMGPDGDNTCAADDNDDENDDDDDDDDDFDYDDDDDDDDNCDDKDDFAEYHPLLFLVTLIINVAISIFKFVKKMMMMDR